MSLFSAANVVLRSRRLIVALALGSAVVVTAVVLASDRTYTATARFVPQTRTTQGNLSGIAAQFGLSVPAADAAQSPEYYVDLLQSREILGPSVDTAYVTSGVGGDSTVSLIERYGGSEATQALRRDAAIGALRERTDATVTQTTGVVAIAVTADSPDLAAQIVQRMLALLDRFNLEYRQSQAGAERRFTERRMSDVREELRRAENELEAFLLRNREYRNSPTLQFQQERLARAVSMHQQVFATVAQTYEQARVEEVRDTPVITVLERPTPPVRPDARRTILKAVLALLAGAMLGILIALARDLFAVDDAQDDDRAEFRRLAREARGELLRPWRLFYRRPARARAV